MTLNGEEPKELDCVALSCMNDDPVISTKSHNVNVKLIFYDEEDTFTISEQSPISVMTFILHTNLHFEENFGYEDQSIIVSHMNYIDTSNTITLRLNESG